MAGIRYAPGYGKMLMWERFIVHFDPQLVMHLGVARAEKRLIPSADLSFSLLTHWRWGIKAKIGSDPVRDAECIQAIREKLGDGISLRADANRGYTVKEAITFCSLVEQYDVGLEILEQPVGSLDLDGLVEVVV